MILTSTPTLIPYSQTYAQTYKPTAEDIANGIKQGAANGDKFEPTREVCLLEHLFHGGAKKAWMSQITINRATKFLGMYASKKEAEDAYDHYYNTVTATTEWCGAGRFW
jgi:hypothetical protein